MIADGANIVFCLKLFFRYGQLSGMVEPIFGILGAVAVTVASIILPYALSFAAGAMIYIVADDILPEAHTRYNNFITFDANNLQILCRYN